MANFKKKPKEDKLKKWEKQAKEKNKTWVEGDKNSFAKDSKGVRRKKVYVRDHGDYS